MWHLHITMKLQTMAPMEDYKLSLQFIVGLLRIAAKIDDRIRLVQSIKNNLPSFFLFLVRVTFMVCASGAAGRTILLLTTSWTAAPESRSTCTALA